MSQGIMTNGRAGGNGLPLPSSAHTGFAKGAIVKIRLKDFMTYNYVEFNPGPNLNLILGPNGTGKSTIVSAICLGMFGKPSTLSRSNTLGGYVRTGAAKGLIDIELNNPEGENYRITREITASDNKSSWRLQGKPADKKEVLELVRKLHIQVDNLCQFLPQEQVQNFSRLNEKELLISTMNAVGNPQLEKDFQRLKQLQVDVGNQANSQEKDEEEVRKLRQENERSESEVASFREREELKASVKIMQKKRLCLQYEEEEKLYKEAEAKRTEKKQIYDQASARFKPLEKRVAKLEHLISQTQEKIKRKRERYNQEMTKVSDKLGATEPMQQQMEAKARELIEKRNMEKSRQLNLRSTEQTIQSWEKELEELAQKERDGIPELRQVEKELNDLKYKGNALFQNRQAAEERVNQTRNEHIALTHRLKTIEDVGNQRLTKLSQERSGVHQAVLWLRANRGQFRAAIHEPMVLSCNIHNPQMAKYVENTISGNDIIAFYCEDKDDMNNFLRIMRQEKRLQGINAVHSPPSPDPSTFDFQPRVALSELRSYGFSSYLRELMSGPEPIIRYHCKNSQIHNIPVGDQSVFENFGTIRDQFGQLFSLFFGGNKRIAVSRSRYRRDPITQVGDVRQAHMFGASVDTRALEDIKAKTQNVSALLAEAQAALEAARAEETAYSRTCESLRARKAQLASAKSNRTAMQGRLDRKRAALQDLEREAIDLVQLEQKMKKDCGDIVRRLNVKFKEHAEALNQLIAHDMEKEALTVYMDVLRSSSAANRQTLEEEKEQIKQLQADKEAADKEFADVSRMAKAFMTEFREQLGARNPSSISDQLLSAFRRLPDNLFDIEDSINNATARINLMGNANEQVVRAYEHREKQIEALVKRISNFNNHTTNLRTQMEETKNNFLPPLLDLISRINASFGKFFASLNCAGEVMLHTGDRNTQDDFENYGIKIRVKFRSKEPLMDLSASHHSGGERAVATALYMLAMQELTQVPFRCVDEINQGMDAINERRVFELLVQTACEKTSSQYFLLTPKLLPGLNYSPNMKIHFVQNGEHVCDEWNIGKHLQLAGRS